MTTATKITIFRILLVPFFIMQILYYVETGNHLYRLLGLLCFALAAISDGIDGYIARHYNQKSELGAMLDPLADKLLLMSGVLLLSIDHGSRFERIPLWMTVVILSRDLLLLLGWFIIHHHAGKVKVRPRFSGKLATVLQMVVVICTLLTWHGPTLTVLAIAATVFTALSGVCYIFDGVKQLS